MIKIGLTGGIGSGKTTIAKIFEDYGIPVYYADNRAKELMQTNTALISKIKNLLGEEAYQEGKLNTKYIADVVFNNKDKLLALEQIVHPLVIQDFLQWVKRQNVEIVVIENAILHKSGMNKWVDYIITVVSEDEIRRKRLLKRDKTTIEEINKRIKNQDNQGFLLKNSNFIIENNFSKKKLAQKVKEILRKVNFELKKS